MAEMAESTILPQVIVRALQLIEKHPNCAGARLARASEGEAWVEIDLKLGFPSAWIEARTSPNGVRYIETATLLFPSNYPLHPPAVFLRKDFDRSLAHVHPGPIGRMLKPCIYDGDLADLLHQQGLRGILNQLVAWLENAAFDRLIDPKQGWEPVRRDSLVDVLCFDADCLRAVVGKDRGYAFLPLRFINFDDSYYAEITGERLSVNSKTIEELVERHQRAGSSLAILVWPGKNLSGKSIIIDKYLPETVVTYADLKERAKFYGSDRSLAEAVRHLEKCLVAKNAPCRFPVNIILGVRRPFSLSESSSDIELCPYLLEAGAPNLLPDGDHTVIRPVAHRHSITPPLLRRLSEKDTAMKPLMWVQLGCGSLGSKIAMHLARAGYGPTAVVDNSFMSPHNAARHTLYHSFLGPKSELLSAAFRSLGQIVETCSENVIAILQDSKKTRKIFPRKLWAIVNSTASLSVREAFAATSLQLPRVIETSLFAEGIVGLMAIEGPQRNPNVGDLITYAYDLIRQDNRLRAAVFESHDVVKRREVGEGCGSVTMVLSDAKISKHAAAMAEQIQRMQRFGLSESNGQILLGFQEDDGLSLRWRSIEVQPSKVIKIKGRSWVVRLAPIAENKILEDVARWPKVETGGLLIGRLSEAARAFYVVDTIPAPEDSERKPHEFNLGKKGLRQVLEAYPRTTNGTLFTLGTWHSHVVDSEPSLTDVKTARALAATRIFPHILLIHTPCGYKVLLADGIED